MRDGSSVECSLPITPNTSHGSLGQEGLHSHLAETSIHEKTSIQV